ncbi:MAG: 6-carboxytetrahydropterin synthase [Bacteroidales bacterium]|nr:6-carboxytetrahydropterin synthase [Bacteroidales bacterium]MDD7724653.1 6-carboxytetrahydropterin synthase [Bacteroidales bacterium]MDY4174372.1 6-carboxytetrahydropterin synthase [Bacteroidales bacterium]
MEKGFLNPIIRVTKEFGFEMAHRLDGYDGLCRNIHGHSYKLAVTVRGRAEVGEVSPKLGMVIDFSVLKSIVNEEVVGRLDHALVVRRGSSLEAVAHEITERVEVVDYQPTCENMVADFACRILRRLPAGLELVSVRLHETATSFAEWVAADNV